MEDVEGPERDHRAAVARRGRRTRHGCDSSRDGLVRKDGADGHRCVDDDEGDPSADAAAVVALRRMRTVAVSLLAFAAVVYLATVDQRRRPGFVNAGAEASMVGAIADWFAVTALFRHRSGCRSRTRRSSRAARTSSAAAWRSSSGETSSRRTSSASASLGGDLAPGGKWLADEANARRVVDEVADVAAIALGKVRDEHIASLVNDALVPRFREEPISPLLGGLLAEASTTTCTTGWSTWCSTSSTTGWLENPRHRAGRDRRARPVVGARQPQRARHRAHPPRDGALGRRHP